MSGDVKAVVLGSGVKALSVAGLYGTVTQIEGVPPAPDTNKARVEVKWDVATVSQYWDLDDLVAI